MRYVYTLAIACCLAVTTIAQGQVVEDNPNPNQVLQRIAYDLGITVVGEATDVVVEVPEGKADTLVVLTAVWCRPCQVIKPGLAALKLAGYKIESYDIDDPEAMERLAEKYSNVKQVKNKSSKVNEWNAVPTLFYVRGDQIIKKDVGYKTQKTIKKTLWKPTTEKGPVANKVNDFRRFLPWNK